MPSEKINNIIDYPKNIRFSSDFVSTEDFQNKLRKQLFFHKDFDEKLNDKESRFLYSKVYYPNI